MRIATHPCPRIYLHMNTQARTHEMLNFFFS
jgi:hypothetical protein